ncbi:hypothetical protein ONZ51_g12015 [Trametes cubensis]|uniref:Uncharacterized protein n=1 Tax=Trametes cubensis TaxID=1111947 RepID=A0AAD7X7A8_9APHY|nr:hypothetical protein ONZ51_g12015 [Trametes cubensis]
MVPPRTRSQLGSTAENAEVIYSSSGMSVEVSPGCVALRASVPPPTFPASTLALVRSSSSAPTLNLSTHLARLLRPRCSSSPPRPHRTSLTNIDVNADTRNRVVSAPAVQVSQERSARRTDGQQELGPLYELPEARPTKKRARSSSAFPCGERAATEAQESAEVATEGRPGLDELTSESAEMIYSSRGSRRGARLHPAAHLPSICPRPPPSLSTSSNPPLTNLAALAAAGSQLFLSAVRLV